MIADYIAGEFSPRQTHVLLLVICQKIQAIACESFSWQLQSLSSSKLIIFLCFGEDRF